MNAKAVDNLLKARQVKAERAEQRRREYAEAQQAFIGWTKCESAQFQRRMRASTTYGRGSMQFTLEDAAWRKLWQDQPIPPPDHAWT